MTWAMSEDVFCVFLESKEDRSWECVSAPDTAAHVAKAVHFYQELHRGLRHLRVYRSPRKRGTAGFPCGYCGRDHWNRCATDELGNPVPLTANPADYQPS